MDISLKEIISLVSIQLGEKGITETHRLVEDLGAESADIANIVAILEEKYGVFINETKIAKISTVQDIYTTITQQLKDQKDS